jgi:TP901 family phage tail tape measure protein
VQASDVHAKFGEAMKASDQLAKKTSGDSAATGSAFDKLGRVGQVAFGAIIGSMGAVVGESVHMAADFQEKMTLLVTGAGESKDQVKGVADGILNMAPKVQTSTSQLADGMYMIESAGFHGAQGLSVLQSAAEGAKTGNADLGTTADALTTVMKDYHIPTAQAADVTSQLVATVASGKTHMQDLAGSMASILPFSSGLGVSLKDTLGAMATMTGNGIQADQAATYLKFSMMALANETPKGATALKDVGLSSITVANDLKSKGLSGTLAVITDAIGKKFPAGSAQYNAAMSDIVGGTRGMAAALSLTGGNAKTYTDNIKKIGGTTAEADGSVKGFSETSQDLNNKLAGIGATFEALGIRLGTALIPMLTDATTNFMNMFNYLSTHQSVLIALAVVVGGVLSVAMGAFFLKMATGMVSTIASYGKMVGSLVKGAVTVVAGFGDMAKGMGDAMGGLEGAYGKMGAFGGQIAGLAGKFGGAISAAGSFGKEMVVNSAKAVASAAATSAAWVATNAKLAAGFALSTAKMIGQTVAAAALKVGELAVAAADAVMTGAQWLLDAALAANPIGLVIIALVALVGGFVLAYNKVGWFKDFINGAFKLIQVVVGAVVQWFVGTVVQWFTQTWNSITAGVQLLYSIFSAYFQLIQSVVSAVVGWFMGTVVGSFQSAMSMIGSAVNGGISFFQSFGSNVQSVIGNIISYFTSLPGQIIGALGNAGSWLVGVGQQIIQGLINGVSGMVQNAVSAVQNIGGQMLNGVKSFLGIKSPSLRFHDEVGVMIGQGVIDGVNSMGPQFAVALNGFTAPPSVDPTRFGSYSGAPGYTPSAQANGGGQPGQSSQVTHTTKNYITVPVTTNADPNQIASALGYQMLLQG